MTYVLKCLMSWNDCMSYCMSVRLCLVVRPPHCLPACLFICLPVSDSLSLSLSACLLVFLSVCLCLISGPSFRLSVCLPVRFLSDRQSVSLCLPAYCCTEVNNTLLVC